MTDFATAPTGYAPTRLTDRIDTLDVLRGVAICGILLMNIPVMGQLGASDRPPLPFAWDRDWIAWMIQSALFEGTMRGLFTMLFGAGMLLMLRRAEGDRPEVTPFDVWARRCLALIALGVVQFALFMWPGEILFNYGITGLLLLAFRTARPRTLLIVGGIVVAVMSLGAMGESIGRAEQINASAAAAAAKARGATLTADQTKALEAREEARKAMHPTPKELAADKARRTSFPGVLEWSAEDWTEWNMGGSGWLLVVTESLGFMLLGMALFRLGVLTGEASAGTYRWMMLAGYGLGVGYRLLGHAYNIPNGFDVNLDRVDTAWFALRGFGYEPARLAITLGHVGLVCTLFRSGALGRAGPLRTLGRTALTAYSLQSILTALLFYAAGTVGEFGFAALMGIAAAIWVVTWAFGAWWLRGHDMGPAEALLRGVAYGTFRRHRAAAATTLAGAPSI